MPNWSQVSGEINALMVPSLSKDQAIQQVRQKYLLQLHAHTGRNVIAYYSGWLHKPGLAHCSIQDLDKNGFMNSVHGLDKSKGLDLILHTPGGDFAATESIVDYLRSMFDINIRCFIPQLAMSGGTMIACACKTIVMGKQSNIGPIDPQFNGIPAHGVIEEFRTALEEIKRDPACIPLWQTIISRYHPTFIGECRNAINLATEIVTNWLVSGMFKDLTKKEAARVANRIVTNLNNHADTKMHARHIHASEALGFGLNIQMLEQDHCLQDIILTIHHTYMHTFSNTLALKIIENQNGNPTVTMAGPK